MNVRIQCWLKIGMAVVVAIAFGGCRPPQDSSRTEDEAVLATVRGKPISASELVSAFEQASAMEDSAESRMALLKSLVLRRALAERALELRLDQDPEIKRSLENVLAGAIRARELDQKLGKTDVSDTEIEDYYRSHSEEFHVQSAFRVAALFLSVRSADPRRLTYQQSRLEEARRRAGLVPESEGFGSLAAEFSEHQASRYHGGVVGWLEGGQLRTFESNCVRIASSLSLEGDLSPVVVAPDGVYLVRLMERRNESVRALSEVRERIRARLLQWKRRQMEDAFEQEVLRQIPVEVYSNRLDLVSLPGREKSTAGERQGTLPIKR